MSTWKCVEPVAGFKVGNVYKTTKYGNLIDEDGDTRISPTLYLDGKAFVEIDNCESIISERESDYGNARHSHKAIADFWSAWLHRRGIISEENSIKESDVAMMMHLLKIARQGFSHKDDNLVDAEAYYKFYKEFNDDVN